MWEVALFTNLYLRCCILVHLGMQCKQLSNCNVNTATTNLSGKTHIQVVRIILVHGPWMLTLWTTQASSSQSTKRINDARLLARPWDRRRRHRCTPRLSRPIPALWPERHGHHNKATCRFLECNTKDQRLSFESLLHCGFAH